MGTDGNGRLRETAYPCTCPSGPTAPVVCTACDEPIDAPGLCERCERVAAKANLGVVAGTRLAPAEKRIQPAKCVDCEAEHDRPRSDRCLPCAVKHRDIEDRQRVKRKRKGEKRPPKECEDCGEPHERWNTTRCARCARVRERHAERDRVVALAATRLSGARKVCLTEGCGKPRTGVKGAKYCGGCAEERRRGQMARWAREGRPSRAKGAA